MNPTGIVLQLAYRLCRHLWAGWPLSRWLGGLLLLAGLVAAVCLRPGLWPALPFAVLWLVYVVLLNWANWRSYVQFQALSHAEPLFQDRALPALRAEELVPVRASGWFTVEGKNQYYVDVEAKFETVETREHMILGRIHPSRFLWLGLWPAWELGWWYIFFQAAMIRELTVGHLHFGRQPRLAIRVVYAPQEETRETIYLTSDCPTALRRVWDDLLRDAPIQVVTSPTLAQPERTLDEDPVNARV